MKKTILAFILLAAFIPANSFAEGKCTVPPVKIFTSDTQTAKIEKIKEALDGYRDYFPSFLSAANNRFEICFEMAEPLDLKNLPAKDAGFDGTFSFAPDPNDRREVYISGLKIKKDDSLNTGEKPIFIVSAGAQNNVVIEDFDFPDIKNRIKVEGAGKVEIIRDGVPIDTGVSIKTNSIENDDEEVKKPSASLKDRIYRYLGI